jgi:Tfp pilus assembly protein PilV
VTKSARAVRDERGFTITEVVVAAMILLVGVLGALTLLDNANRATQRTKAREGATNTAREIVEAARAIPYPDLTPDQLATQLQLQPELGDQSASTDGWQLKRRNITYTVTATVCSVDDGTLAADGFGNHTGGTFCADSATTGTVDNNPDDYKRLAITVSWQDGAKTLSTSQEAVINNPGSAFAPAVKTLWPSTGAYTSNPVVTNAAVTAITFRATMTSTPSLVKWQLDNVEAGNATGSNTIWQFTWDIPQQGQPGHIVDGTYLVSANGFDKYGQAGTGRTLTMVINRYAPARPTGFVAGRNPLWGSGFVEFDWQANGERDILGYRVYRVASVLGIPAATDPVVCQTLSDDTNSTSTRCAATSEPGGLQRYYVRAVAPSHTGTGEEQSDLPLLTGVQLVSGANVRPDAPTNVVEDTVVDDGGMVTIRWDAPVDPDGSVAFYRIYRDDQSAWTVRYGNTDSGASVLFTDGDGAPGAHRYWITAVDNELAESDFAPAGGFVP